ncbi:hypothetical protein [Heliobacterium chlorum]|nr:hypothetical protein [Heliobacterium chlorum]
MGNVIDYRDVLDQLEEEVVKVVNALTQKSSKCGCGSNGGMISC